ncbi:MAG: hypothetical protein QOE75_2651 [Solirubrobacterales bacterium]|jgi:hypothetical protein|nr:hypothetical protein [Solirubrobacterales bacterium]
MRIAFPLATVVLTAALLAGCGDSGDGNSERSIQATPQVKGATAPAGASAQECKGGAGAGVMLRATGIPCSVALDLVKAWEQDESCPPAAGASRSSCEIVGGYRCLSVVTDRGVSVSCARPGHSIAFTAKRG